MSEEWVPKHMWDGLIRPSSRLSYTLRAVEILGILGDKESLIYDLITMSIDRNSGVTVKHDRSNNELEIRRIIPSERRIIIYVFDATSREVKRIRVVHRDDDLEEYLYELSLNWLTRS